MLLLDSCRGVLPRGSIFVVAHGALRLPETNENGGLHGPWVLWVLLVLVVLEVLFSRHKNSGQELWTRRPRKARGWRAFCARGCTQSVQDHKKWAVLCADDCVPHGKDARTPLINNHLNDSSARQPPGTASASIPRATVRAPKRPEGFGVTDLARRRRGTEATERLTFVGLRAGRKKKLADGAAPDDNTRDGYRHQSPINARSARWRGRRKTCNRVSKRLSH